MPDASLRPHYWIFAVIALTGVGEISCAPTDTVSRTSQPRRDSGPPDTRFVDPFAG